MKNYFTVMLIGKVPYHDINTRINRIELYNDLNNPTNDGVWTGYKKMFNRSLLTIDKRTHG